jgi:hypothetical protein
MFCSNCGTANADDAVFCQKCGADLRTASATGNPGTGMPSGAPMPAASVANPMPNSFNVVGALKHAVDLVRSPANVMRAYSDTSVNSIIINYVAILAAIDFIGTLIGNSLFINAGYGITSAILFYILGIIQVFVVGFIIWKLAPSFGTNTTQVRSLALAAYAFTPYFLVSILKIIPIIGLIVILGLLYGLYILYLGIPIMLGTAQDKTLVYFIVILVVTFVVYAIISFVIGAITLAAFGVSAGL